MSASRIVLMGTFGAVVIAWYLSALGFGVWDLSFGQWLVGFAAGAFGVNEWSDRR